MKILIIGAGAIGGSLACYLYSVGSNITVLEKNKELCEVVNRDGMLLVDGNNEYRAAVRATDSLSPDEKFDCCFTATRAYSLKAAVLSVLPNLTEDAFVISMNNGICINPLMEAVGKDRAVWCSVNFGAGISAPARYFIKIHGGVTIGMKDGMPSSMLRVVDILKKAIPVTVTDNIVGALYSKMLINSCITSTAVVSGLTLGEILKRESGRVIFTEIIREGMEMATAAGIVVPNYEKKFNYHIFASYGLVGKIYRAIVFPKLIKRYGSRTSSTLEALKRGTRTEIGFFNGYVVHLSNKFHRAAPVNQAVVKSVQEVEKNLDLIGADRLENLALVALAAREEEK